MAALTACDGGTDERLQQEASRIYLALRMLISHASASAASSSSLSASSMSLSSSSSSWSSFRRLGEWTTTGAAAAVSAQKQASAVALIRYAASAKNSNDTTENDSDDANDSNDDDAAAAGLQVYEHTVSQASSAHDASHTADEQGSLAHRALSLMLSVHGSDIWTNAVRHCTLSSVVSGTVHRLL
jgi:hypothetical protein